MTVHSTFVEESAGCFFFIILRCQVSVKAKMDAVSFQSRVIAPADLTGERAVRWRMFVFNRLCQRKHYLLSRRLQLNCYEICRVHNATVIIFICLLGSSVGAEIGGRGMGINFSFWLQFVQILKRCWTQRNSFLWYDNIIIARPCYMSVVLSGF